jgi:hypothetical protein
MTSNVITSGIVNRALLNATKLGLAHIVEFIFSEHLFLDLNPELELQDNESLTNLYTFSLFYLVDAETKGLMLSYAVEQRDANMIELILSKLDQISLVHLSYSLKAMIKTGNQDITLMLLNYIKSQGIDFRSLNLTKGDYPIYFLTFAEVENDPMLFLNDLSNGFPARIILKDNFFVVDISGVTKQFLGVLFSSLVKKISLDENKLPLILGVDDDLPLEIHTKALREKERLENIFSLLGTAINSLYLKNQDRSDKYVFGNLFHTQFFQILKYVESSLRFEERLSEEDLYKLTAKLIAKIDPKITAAFIVAPHETQEDILEFAKVFEIPSGISEKEQIKRIQTKISEVITLFDQAFDCQDPSERLLLAKSHIKTYIHPAQKLFEALSDECKAFLKDTSARVLAAHVQGKKATAEALIRALFINEEIALKGLLQKVEWLKEKITSSNDQWREAFVFTITGNNFLSPGIRINIKNSSQELFEVHTCFNSIDLPKGKMSKIRFLEGIDSILQDPSYNVS